MMRRGLIVLVLLVVGTMAWVSAASSVQATPAGTQPSKPPPSPVPAGTAVLDDGGIIRGIARVPVQASRLGGPKQRAADGLSGYAPRGSTPKQRWELARVNIGECNVDGGDPGELCPWDPDTNAPAAVFPRSAAEAIAREVVAQLQLPPANPQVGPDPDWNEWKRAVIGHPLWLWVDGPRTMSASNTDFGLTVALDARHVSTTFTMGDGTTRTCATTQAYVRERVEPGAPSPVCGHTYQCMPKLGDSYPVTATTHWSVGWSAAGYSGTLPATMSASRDLPVTELQAVVIRHR